MHTFHQPVIINHGCHREPPLCETNSQSCSEANKHRTSCTCLKAAQHTRTGCDSQADADFLLAAFGPFLNFLLLYINKTVTQTPC